MCGKVLVTAREAGGERRAKIRDLQKFTIDTGRAGSRMQGPPCCANVPLTPTREGIRNNPIPMALQLVGIRAPVNERGEGRRGRKTKTVENMEK